MSGPRAVHEHEFEPEPGLPEPLPADEHVLWQGAPDWRALARRVFHVRAVALYFAAILLLRGTLVVHDGGSLAEALRAVALAAPLFVFALAGLIGIAFWSAATTAYTITDRRVVMRVGIVLSVTYNLPYARIEGAALSRHATHRDLAITLLPGDQIAWAHLWPHVRPWQLRRTQPMLRCLPEAERVAALLTQAWSRATGLAPQPQLHAVRRPPAEAALAAN